MSIEYFGEYRVLSLVNVGQSSRIYRAYDDRARRSVCVKTLLDGVLVKEQVELLKWEYDVLLKLNYPKLCQVYSFGWCREVPYIVMEWFPASNVKLLISRGYDQYYDHIERIIFDMADSLSYLHLRGWVHRDVKPDNFLFDVGGCGIRLIDFAIARRCVGGIARFLARRSPPQGTASYIAPEQIKGLPPECSADIYSLGCAYYEILTTRVPFSGDSVNDLLKKHIASPPPVVAAKNKNVTKEFSDLVKIMMSKSQNDRPKNATELLKLLKTTRIFQKKHT
ncbi:MAG: serine/threonine protein kinase [Planctomycetaceae bacterium]|jgi:serine/threonine protein kinase|nr:serine/threonine protein kinase [Planctomycetaceae bacterium]